MPNTDERNVPSFTSHVQVRNFLDGEPELVQVAYNYLGSLPQVLWADWDISIPERRILAARWLASQYTELQKVLTKHIKHHTHEEDDHE